MRYWAIVLCSVLVGGFLWNSSAFGQETFEGLVERVNQLTRLLNRSIILTDQDCASLGENWRRYATMDGKIPLAAGEHTDVRGDTRTFAVGQADGAYAHQLTEAEMPSHTHDYHDRYFNNDRRGGALGDDDDRERHYRNDRRRTGPTGGNEPHNNMPPYHVLNFCHNAGN